jgi:hypothetical protein
LSSKDWQSQNYGTAALLPMWYDQRNLTSYYKNTWDFILQKIK